MLVCPSAAKAAICVSSASPRPVSTGCRNQSTAASARAPAMSLATAWVMDSPGSANVMLPTVVIPPAMAASEPVQKSSTQTGSPGSAAATWAVNWAHIRCTWASMPPGITSKPPASISPAPVMVPPSWAIRPPVMPTSACSR